MIELPEEEIATLCRKYAVNKLWAFGSAVTDKFDPDKSDIDLLVEFGPPPPGMGLAAQFFDLWEEFRCLFQRNVDLVERSAIQNPYFLHNIAAQERLLYAA